jgi:hypothetical protein
MDNIQKHILDLIQNVKCCINFVEFITFMC